jgi:fucose 4-O-acetylase-like acetyltransferase
MLPLVARIPFAATLSVPAAVLTGYVPWIGVRFSLARTLAFLPFFLAGYRLRGSGRTPLLRAVPAPLAAAALLLAGTAAFVWRWTDVEKWLWCHAAYAILGRPEWWAGAARLGVLAGAAGLGAAVLSLVPASENLLTRFGRRALYIYVLHMVVIEVLVKAGFYSAVSPLLLTALAAPLALGLALVLSSEPVRTLTMCLVDVPAFVAMCRQKVANRRLRPPSGP